MARLRRKRFADPFGPLGVLFSIPFFVFWFGALIYGIVGQVRDITSIMELRRDASHTTGVALATRSEQWTDSDGTSYSVSFTKVGYTVGTVRHVEEISGRFAVGEKVPIVYDEDEPDVVRPTSGVDTGSIVWDVIEIVFMLGMIAFGIGFARSWYTW
jgi:hypothetical protein